MFECFKKKPVRRQIQHEPTKLSRNYPRPYLDLALRVTGSFEGSGFDQVTGNFDGQGISAGVLQWCYGQGSLQNKILKPYIDKYGTQVLDNFFPRPISESAYMTNRQAIRFAKKHMLSGKSVKHTWKMAWKQFLTSPETIEIQKKGADSVASKAWFYCNKHKMISAKSFCFFFDVVTQNGSLKNVPKPTSDEGYIDAIDRDAGINKTDWLRSSPDYETKILFIWITRRVTRNKWAADVISRKGTIAHGIGTVHQKKNIIAEAYVSTENQVKLIQSGI